MTERRYQKRSADDWMHLVDRQARSGLSQAAFCRSEGVPLSTFRYWKRRLHDEGRLEAASTDVPLFTPLGDLPAAEPIEEPGFAEAGWRLDLDLGDGLRLTLRKVA